MDALDKVYRIPKENVGRVIEEERVKAGLTRLNPGIFFDVAGRNGLSHMYIDYRQGVYFSGFPPGRQHICSMDRGWAMGGVIVEVPVETTKWDLVEIPLTEVDPSEGLVMPCFHDDSMAMVKRQTFDEVILCGWRHTFDKIVAARVPGVTYESLSAEFGMTIRDHIVKPVEVPEEGAPEWDRQDVEDDGKILEAMGLYRPKPTVIIGCN